MSHTLFFKAFDRAVNNCQTMTPEEIKAYCEKQGKKLRTVAGKQRWEQVYNQLEPFCFSRFQVGDKVHYSTNKDGLRKADTSRTDVITKKYFDLFGLMTYATKEITDGTAKSRQGKTTEDYLIHADPVNAKKESLSLYWTTKTVDFRDHGENIHIVYLSDLKSKKELRIRLEKLSDHILELFIATTGNRVNPDWDQSMHTVQITGNLSNTLTDLQKQIPESYQGLLLKLKALDLTRLDIETPTVRLNGLEMADEQLKTMLQEIETEGLRENMGVDYEKLLEKDLEALEGTRNDKVAVIDYFREASQRLEAMASTLEKAA